MLLSLPPDQRELAEFMSSISERCYSAAWIENLEHILWDQINGHQSRTSRTVLTEAETTRLRLLSDRCRGWIVFDDKTEETYVPLSEWKIRSAKSG